MASGVDDFRRAESAAFLLRNHVWHILSENPPVTSCADAAFRRRRLGNVGIPLCDELKSLLYTKAQSSDPKVYYMFHCRAHQQIDLHKASTTAGAELARVDAQGLVRSFGAEYGSISPFLSLGRSDVRHIVDETVLDSFYPPHTMMTNVGDLRHAVEFRPRELFAAIPKVTVADIISDRYKRVPTSTIGILTGNSPESGMLLWQTINRRIRSDSRVRFRGDTGFPRTVVESVPDMGSSMDLTRRADDLRPLVLAGIQRLCEGGANVIGVACNTTQFFATEIQEVCAAYGAQFIATADATAKHLRGEGVDTFELLGIGPVTDLGGWSGFGRAFDGFTVSIPTAATLAAVEELAFTVKREMVSPSAINRLRDTVNSLQSTTVVIALTELSLLFAQQKRAPRSGKRYIDTLAVLADAMAEIYLEERIAVGGA